MSKENLNHSNSRRFKGNGLVTFRSESTTFNYPEFGVIKSIEFDAFKNEK